MPSQTGTKSRKKGKRGKSQSPYPLGQRRRLAFEKYVQGWTPTEVAGLLQVSLKTACRYRDEYEAEVTKQARENPGLLTDFLENTERMLRENNMIRARAWEGYEVASAPKKIECPECGEELHWPSASHATINQYLNTITKAQDQRAKLLGMFGVKAEFFTMVNNVRLLQDLLLQFMRAELCSADKAKLERLLTEGQGASLMESTQNLPVLEAAVLNAG